MPIQLVASDCSMWPPGRQRRRAVEDADVVEAEEPALEDVLALGVLAVDPPGEVQEQLVEDALEELAVALARPLLVDLVDAPGRPRVHGRVHVAEGPLVGRQLPVRVHVPLAQQQHELLLGEVGVDEGERDAVEREVPRGVPGVLPLVRHRDDVGVEEVASSRRCGRASRSFGGSGPCGIAAQPAGRRRSGRTAWTTACRRKPGAAPRGRPPRGPAWRAWRRRRWPRGCARRTTASKSAPNGSSGAAARERRRRMAADPPAGIVRT